jgi:site-specific recombinase XerD
MLLTTTAQNSAIVTLGNTELPVLIRAAGERATYRFVEFFTAQIRNPNTRRAYHVAISQFFLWCHSQNLQLQQIHSIHVATYVEQLQQHVSAPTVKQHMAAIRKLFDWLVVGHVLETNPSHAVRGPKHVVKRGKTPILTPEDTRALFDSIPTDSLIGLRDRALMALMVYSFARVGAAVKMRVKDYYPNGKRWWIRLHEKGGKRHEMPAHHTLERYLDEYIEAAGIREDKKGFLFRTFKGKTGMMTENPMLQTYAWQMVQRRVAAAGLAVTDICNHSFRGTGITTYLKNGGTLEKAQQMANHESPRTTKLYDRTSDEISLDEVEKIII